jgi:putative ABC transport system permease protein
MLKNFLKTTLRVLYQNKGFTAINILGLAIGIACCIFIALYINHEVSFDRFHKNSKQIYQLTVGVERNGEMLEYSPVTTPKMGEDLLEYIPEVEKILRFGFGGGNFKVNDKLVSSGTLLFADSTLWDFFDFKLKLGDAQKALKDPFSLVVSESLAQSFFGNDEPLGKVVLLDGKVPYTITGVVEDCPTNTRIKYKGFISFSTLYQMKRGTMTEWDGNFSFRTLMLLSKDADINEVVRKSNDFADQGINQKLAQANVKFIMGLQALRDLHLYNTLMYEKPGVAKTLYLLSAIALFILFIAGFNFVNLTTARSTRRAKEVGMRMTVGASKGLIRIQFIGESIILGIVSALISLLVVELLIPSFNNLLGLNLSLYHSNAVVVSITIPIFIIVFGFIAGLYPAYFLSSFKPIRVLKTDFGGVRSKASIRNILVTIQFVVSSLLIIATSIVYLQLNYIKTKNLGFNAENLLVAGVMGENKWQRADRLIEEIKKLPEVDVVDVSNQIPGYTFTQNGYRVEGVEDNVMIRTLAASHTYLQSIGATFKNGRSLSKEFTTDEYGAVVNESLVKIAGWDDPIGKKITRGGEKEFTVVGVVKDFHFRSLHESIEPLIVFLPFDYHSTFWNPNIHIRFKEGMVKSGLEKTKEVWQRVEGNPMVTYNFVKDIFNNQYRAEDNIGSLFIYFTILAIFISCLGLLGLSSFLLENRMREIGIRKVLGSGTISIVTKFSVDFTRWSLLGTLISWPIAWYFAKEWLSNFAYQISIPWSIFVFAAFATLIISVTTILFQTLKATRTNPVEILKYE